MNNTNTKTLLGQEIKPGDYIAYGQALGRCAAMNIGRVIEAGLKPLKRFEDDDKVEFRCKITALDYDWFHDTYTRSKTARTLQFAERIVVLHPDTVPASIKDVLGT